MMESRGKSDWRFVLHAGLAAFVTYTAMYGYRKGFTAAGYEDLSLWGLDYKSVLVITQVLGYALSKFIGIRFISGMKSDNRIRNILILIGISQTALILFAFTPYPWNFIWLFFNGLPLGLIWGLVFSYLEGRKYTELLGAILATSFIVASGLVKSTGTWVLDIPGVSQFQMPSIVGFIFALPLALGTFFLKKIPPPTDEDKAGRTERVSMNSADRKNILTQFGTGLLLIISAYILLSILRDFRDNFIVDIWKKLGYTRMKELLTTAELPIALICLLMLGVMYRIRDNYDAFRLNLWMVAAGALILLISTLLFLLNFLDPLVWMILSGLGIYIGYIVYNTILFERFIATFRIRGNIGYLFYIADAFGYIGSVAVLLLKNLSPGEMDYLSFYENMTLILSLLILILLWASAYYFRKKYQNYSSADERFN
jgi:MFS family permease